ncbi:guanylate kinase [Mesosutterella sp. OilRF-GAM-744-9]|uniref:Guanylate kinase n=2 Tax=Mesosutterella TaxID=2494213 RepID=A0ABS9MTM3_9BURK|nr:MULTISPECIES: guanylate kinase [unclassified Mesosutterella]MCG5031590.1 guanylate kinase [Mesosutterella sp. oilRF-744-WT-GAM-9]MDL2059160.1 guanylate kinase [Mesosutterella sp. AGMB02718]
MATAQNTGLLFLVSAPSGAGKSSLVHALIESDPRVHLSISFTTRGIRPGEADGRDYNFISLEEFEQRKQRGEFLEWAFVHGNYYGTNKLWIEKELSAGHDVMLEIDWQGAFQVKKIFPGVISTFILPPSIETLKQRLVGRGTDAPEVIAKRLSGAGAEIVHAPQFDYVIINRDFDQAARELQSIVAAARLRFSQQKMRNRELFSRLGVPG